RTLAGGVFSGELRRADIEFIWQDRNIYLPTLHAELVGLAHDFLTVGDQTLTVRIGDDDVDVAGARRPIARARGRAQSGAETLTGTTDANGEVTFTFAQPLG